MSFEFSFWQHSINKLYLVGEKYMGVHSAGLCSLTEVFLILDRLGSFNILGVEKTQIQPAGIIFLQTQFKTNVWWIMLWWKLSFENWSLLPPQSFLLMPEGGFHQQIWIFGENFVGLVQHVTLRFISALLYKMSSRNRRVLCAVSDVVHHAIRRATRVGAEEPEGKVWLFV